MSDADFAKRIAQFENMATADPENEMAHFSLAGVYVQAGRFADAAASYERCTEYAPGMSKAYQLAAENLIKVGEKDRAVQLLLRGYAIAAERGDLMPKNAMGDMLKSLGRDVPQVASAGGKPGGGDVNLLGGGGGARKSGGFEEGKKPGEPGGGTKMQRPPFKGPVGEWIFEHVPQEKFDQWIGQGTKVINELRLDLSRDEDEAVYDQHMREYLGIDEALYQKLTGGNKA